MGKNSINSRVGHLDQLDLLNMRICKKICGYMCLFGTAYSFFPTTNKSGWPMAIGHLISTAMCYINSTGFPFMFPLCKLSLVFVLPDKATGSTLCVARGQLCRGSSVGIQATEEMATTIGRPVHVTCEWWSSKSVQIDNQESCLNARRKSFLRAQSGRCLCLCHFSPSQLRQIRRLLWWIKRKSEPWKWWAIEVDLLPNLLEGCINSFRYISTLINWSRDELHHLLVD